MLTQRQESILELVVDEYIESATPVSSRLLASRQELPLSSATIRNELAHSNPIDEITRVFLVNYYNLWKKWLCKDEEKSDLV